ncbi:hypothetical protein [Alteribacter aurantiacus]|uniref:hypothetical protein n=1 Tax=Alteribacter aurantiacus TaxID=254410 RepID=UPI0003F9D8FB|nr:hypothetical protein [Alteribacter aurantiacus]
MKSTYIFLILACFLIGCSTESDTISGTTIGQTDNPFMFILFKEDSKNGDTYDPLTIGTYGEYELDEDDYHVEAYLIYVTDQTRMMARRGEELVPFAEEEDVLGRISFQFSNFKFDVDVTVKEPFESTGKGKQMTPSAYSWNLIPVYTAEEIIVTQPTKEELISQVIYDGDMDFLTVIEFSDDPFTIESHYMAGEAFWELGNFNRSVFYTRASTKENQLLFDQAIDSFPTFLVFNRDGVVFEGKSEDETVSFIQSSELE